MCAALVIVAAAFHVLPGSRLVSVLFSNATHGATVSDWRAADERLRQIDQAFSAENAAAAQPSAGTRHE